MDALEPPVVRYAQSGDVSLAYQVVGSGAIDLIFVMGWISNLEYMWKEPRFARFLTRLASFSRLIMFDKRGTGLSDRVANEALPTLEMRMDDVRAVMDAAGSQRAALLGISEGGSLCALFAASYPERTRALIMIGSYARERAAPGYEFGRPNDEFEGLFETIRRDWGTPSLGIEARVPSVAHEPAFRDWWAAYLRMSASPGAAVALTRMNADIDIRPILPAIRVPTMVVHASGDRAHAALHGRYLAEHIPGARLVVLDSQDHLPWIKDTDQVIGEVEQLLTGARTQPEPDRVLATVLYTDIVDSTKNAAKLGDQRWRALLEAHDATLRREITRFRGRAVKSTGDGVLATFDGPARAIRCALAIAAAVQPLGVAIRAGLHTGEIELIGDDIAGIAVHIGARVQALAGPGEVVVSSTVKDLVAGSGLAFTARGAHTLKGVPGEWQIFAATAA